MKGKTIFSQIIFLIILAMVCVTLTVGIAILVGTAETTFFDFSNLNFGNMLPVLLIGGFISCVVIGIMVLFISRSVFYKVKEHLIETKDNGGKEK